MTGRKQVSLAAPLAAAALYAIACFLPGEPSGARRVSFTLDFAQPYRVPLAGVVQPALKITADGQPLTDPKYRLESLDRGVVRVDSTGHGLQGVARGTASVRVVYETATGAPDTTFAVRVVVSRVAVGSGSLTLTRLADTSRLTATAYDAQNGMVPGVTFTWASMVPRVATVDTAGLVVALNEGQSVITAEADSVTGSASVSVTQVATAVRMVPKLDTLRTVGRSTQFLAVALDSANTIIPTAKPRWTSSDERVARVDTAGRAAATGAGTAVIVARVGEAADTATLVVAQAVRFLTVQPSFDTLKAIAATARHTVLAFDSLMFPIAYPVVAWATADTAIATVDSTGLVRAVKNGVVLVTASADRQSAFVTVVVRQEAVAVRISPDSVTLTGAGDTARLTAVGLDRNGFTVAGEGFNWRSGSECVAGVDAGLVTARYGGTTPIIAVPLTGGQADTAIASVGGTPCPAPSIAYVTWSGIVGRWPGSDSGIVLAANGDHYYDEPSWSPDGANLAFSGKDASWQDSDIFVATADGSSRRALPDWPSSEGPHWDSGPAWSPDGTRIAFVRSNYGEQGTIAVASTSGLDVRVLWKCEYYCGRPAWSPDGARLAFGDAPVDMDYGLPKIWTINSASGADAVLLSGYGSEPAWSPDGSLIAFNRGGGVWLIKADGSGERSISPDWLYATNSVAWSPDGFRLVFAASDWESSIGLYLINWDGSGTQLLASAPDGAWSPAWRPTPPLASRLASRRPVRMVSP